MCISGLLHSVLLLYSHSDFTAIVELPEGRHEYKFFVDGQWLHDPNEVQYIHVHVQMYKCVDTLYIVYVHCIYICMYGMSLIYIV